MHGTPVRIEGVSKRFGETVALNDVHIEIQPGEFFTLLGPSGCGKTTLLRTLAGFVQADKGRIFFGERRIDGIPAHKRNIGLVFQDYALFPHLSVFDNVAYGLKARGVPRAEIATRVMEALKLVDMEGLQDRKPSQMSGGQQQRVAVARAIVIRPDLLLMDEPLSNLDAKLRVQMRRDLRSMQSDVQLTTVYVTHDQVEALAVSDRIAVMRQGTIQQIGTPAEIYLQPANAFVARFLGNENVLKARVVERQGHQVMADHQGMIFALPPANVSVGDEVEFVIRSECLRVVAAGSDGERPTRGADASGTGAASHRLTGTLERLEYGGSSVRYQVATSSGASLEAVEYDPSLDALPRIGDQVTLAYDPQEVTLLGTPQEAAALRDESLRKSS